MITTGLLYVEFIASGLSYILLAMNIPISRQAFAVLPLCDWATSVYLLCVAHILHAVTVFGGAFAMQYTVLGLGVVAAMEEFGLRTGLTFGEYHFTPALGYFLTNHLPALVPFLWFALSYPIFVFTYLILEKQRRRSSQHIGLKVLTASALLTGYDLISDPIGVLYGNNIWYHAAHVDSVTSLETFVPKPDWVFGPRETAGDQQQSRFAAAAYPQVVTYLLNALSTPCHYNIPLHVSASVECSFFDV